MTSLPARRAFAAGLGVAALTATVIAGASPAGAAPTPPPTDPVPLQLLALNDFHGQLERPTGSSSTLPGFPDPDGRGPLSAPAFGGVEHLATQVRELEAAAASPNTLTVAAGDLIGASPLLSAAFHDEPTIEALERIGLDYASVGNHEFDEGPAELLRIQNGGCHPEDGCSDPELPYDGADFQYLSANAFVDATGESLLPEVAIHKVQGIKVGFIGMTLEGTPSVVTPSGVAGLTFADEAETANRHARNLQRAGAEAIVVLLHEGGRQSEPGTYNTCTGMGGAITGIVPRFSSAIDVVVTGHSHQPYNCRYTPAGGFQPSGGATSGGMLVTSAANVGKLVTDIDLTLDPVTGDVLTSRADNVLVNRDDAPAADMTALIAKWRTLLGPIASEVVGNAAETLSRTQESWTVNVPVSTDFPDGTRTYAGESPLGNLIADGQLAATPGSVAAFMNPGGVRAEIQSGPITYEEAFSVQPFGNYLSQITVTDAVLQCVLEQQFVAGNILQPAGITYTVDRNGVTNTDDPCAGTRVVDSEVTIGGTAIATDGIDTYRITVNNFLADGGDGFTQFRLGTARQDVAQPEDDLQALIQYLDPTVPTSAPATDRITVTG
jgi:5'-nucleotidase